MSMLDFYYVSGTGGEKVDFHQPGMLCSENALRGYSWEYSISRGRAHSFQLKTIEKPFDVLFCQAGAVSAAELRQHVYEIVDTDVRRQTPGRLYVGDYYIDCYIVGADDEEVTWDSQLIKTKLAVIGASGKWRKENVLHFFGRRQVADSTGMSYPYDYPYDYAAAGSGAQSIENGFSDSDFLLKFFGPAVNPSVTIAGHKYGLIGEIVDGEWVEIDSATKSITKYAADRSSVSWFAKRYKPQSIFEKIPAGISPLVWDGMCPFDLTILEERSEPLFDPDGDIPDSALCLPGGEYLVLPDGSFVIVAEE